MTSNSSIFYTPVNYDITNNNNKKLLMRMLPHFVRVVGKDLKKGTFS